MREVIDQWGAMFSDNADWLGPNCESLGLPAAIAGELARLVTVELESTVAGSARGDYLDGEYKIVLDDLRKNAEFATAGGGVVFKPYVDGGHIAVDCVPAWRFLPTAFNARGDVTGAVFVEQSQKSKVYYTRMEYHRRTAAGYEIKNLAFKSYTDGQLGTPCGLDEVDEWAALEPELTIGYKNGTVPEGMLFAYFRMPFANQIDGASPLGVSVYSRAVGLIREADKQYSRILWEYEGSELAVDASEGALKLTPDGKAKMPERKKRLFREVGLDRGTSGDLYEIFSPSIRDTSLFNGLDKLLKRIEFNCYLSYGTLSDPESVDKTAEEIKTSKQRSYSAVRDIQRALEKALRHLVWAMDLYATLYNLAPRGVYDVSFAWGDGVMENADIEFTRRKNLVDSGYLKAEELIKWYFGVDDEGAAALMPEETGAGLFGGE
jgi:A118 family predicted phage portal protein